LIAVKIHQNLYFKNFLVTKPSEPHNGDRLRCPFPESNPITPPYRIPGLVHE